MPKYKVWDETEKKMKHTGVLHIISEENFWYLETNKGNVSQDNGVLLQYVEGLDLCEGDIIKYSKYIGVIIKEYGNFDVKWDNDIYPDWSWSEMIADKLSSIKVIGNKFENPDKLPDNLNNNLNLINYRLIKNDS